MKYDIVLLCIAVVVCCNCADIQDILSLVGGFEKNYCYCSYFVSDFFILSQHKYLLLLC